MRVELLVNLKIGGGRVISSGSVFSDENAPIPEFVLRRLNRRQARILPDVATAPLRTTSVEVLKPKPKSVVEGEELKSAEVLAKPKKKLQKAVIKK